MTTDERKVWDMYAAAALNGLTTGRMIGPSDYDGLALEATKIADALLAERRKSSWNDVGDDD